jgi:ADP-heptose:LPS heptosyltransferase
LGPTANWPQKTWSPHYFAELAWRLANPQGPLANARIILHGGPGEEKDLEPIIKTLPPGLVTNLAGCRLPVAAAAMQRSVIYIGNDSGLTHLSAAAGVPTLALFGPTREDLYAPWGDHAMAIRGSLDYDALLASPGFDIERHESQMGDLDVDMVYNAVIDLLNSQNKGS